MAAALAASADWIKHRLTDLFGFAMIMAVRLAYLTDFTF